MSDHITVGPRPSPETRAARSPDPSMVRTGPRPLRRPIEPPSPTAGWLPHDAALFTGSTRIQRMVTTAGRPVLPVPVSRDGARGVVRRHGDEWRLDWNKKRQQTLNQSPLGALYQRNGALHHHISKAKMSEITASVKEAARAGGDTMKAAQRFELRARKILTEAFEAKPKDLDQVTLDRVLHNLPFNLHYGPAKVSGNPGSRFDPSTEEGPQGVRVETAMTVALRTLQNRYDADFDTLGAALDPDSWDALTKLLEDAYDLADPNRPIETTQEQWLLADDVDNVWTKKGNLRFAEVNAGVQRFQVHQGPAVGGSPAVVVASVRQAFQFDIDTVELVVYFTAERLDHFCNRHTYLHFDFNDVKPLNVFWPPGTTRAGLTATVTNRLAAIKNEIVADAGVAGVDDPSDFDDRIKVTIGKPGFKQTLGDGTVYYAAVEAANPPANLTVGDDNFQALDANFDPNAGQLTRRYVGVEMFAPTGPTFDAYDTDTMNEIYDEL